MTWQTITLIAALAAVLATLLIFIIAFVMEKISNYRYHLKAEAEKKAERDDIQDRRLRNLEAR